MKTCTKCRESLDESCFYVRKNRKNQIFHACKKCCIIMRRILRQQPDQIIKQREYNKRKRREDLQKARAYDRIRNLRLVHGITVQEYEWLFAKQNGLCAICGKPETSVLNGKNKRLSIDHCHETQETRGLLCGRCNTAIGLMFDDVLIVESAAAYLLSPVKNPLPKRKKNTPPKRRRKTGDLLTDVGIQANDDGLAADHQLGLDVALGTGHDKSLS